MGIIAKVISSEIVDREGEKTINLTVDMGGGDTDNVEFFCPPGLDSCPMQDDYVLILGESATGCIDNASNEKTDGSTRLYARNSQKRVVGEVMISPDGKIEIKNSKSSISLDSAGKIKIGGNAANAAILGDAFKGTYDVHGHPSAFGITGPPVTPLPANNLSTVVEVE